LTDGENWRKMRVSPIVKLWRRIMRQRKMTVEELDAHRRRKRSRELTVVGAATQVAVPPSAPSAVAPSQSITDRRPFAPTDVIDATYIDVPKTRPAIISGGFMIAIGLALAAVGLANNFLYNAAFGQSPADSWQLGTLGLIIDAVAITALSGSIQLWSRNWVYS